VNRELGVFEYYETLSSELAIRDFPMRSEPSILGGQMLAIQSESGNRSSRE
jgi:hypothetical protein